MEWSNEVIMEFLNLYEGEPAIWNPQNADHKDRNKIHDAWKRIQENISIVCSVTELKRKKEHLMATYRKLVSKVKNSEKTVAGIKIEPYKPEWFAYEKMASFLQNIYTPRKTERFLDEIACGSPIAEDSIQVKSDLSADYDDTSNTQDSDVPSNLILEPEIVISNERSELKTSASKEKSIFQAIEELKKLQKMVKKDHHTVTSPNNLENQFDIFGKSVAAQLKLIPIDRALMAQSQIQDILSQHAIEYYREKNSPNNSRSFNE